MAFGEVVLVAAIAFHAFNGLRVIAVDFFKGGTKHHKTLFWVAMGLWAVVMVGFLWRHIPNSLGGIF
jgi:succinate dehydrogenase / fumarate reductase cytochrome b subunit